MKYTIRRDAYGAACAIERDGVTVLHLATGTERNAENAESIVAALNKAALFDALEKLPQAEIYIDKDGSASCDDVLYLPVTIHIMRIKGDEVDVEMFGGDTLAKAVEKALAAEGDSK